MPWPDREQQPPPGSSGLRSSPIMIYAPSAGPTLAPSLPQLASDTGGGAGGGGGPGGQEEAGSAGREEGTRERLTRSLSICAWAQHLSLGPYTSRKA